MELAVLARALRPGVLVSKDVAHLSVVASAAASGAAGAAGDATNGVDGFKLWL